MGRKIENLVGKTFGSLKVLFRTFQPIEDIRNRKAPLWTCECVCGTVRPVRGAYLKNGKTKSCGCRRHETSGHRLRPFESMYNTFVAKARWRRPIEITYQQFLAFTEVKICHYCWAALDWSSIQRYNLDRKDNHLGYTVENCVACCPRCNAGKGDRFTYQEWFGMTAIFRRKHARERGYPRTEY